MTIALNHSILAARDRPTSASFLATLFGFPDPISLGPFAIVTVDNGMAIQFAEPNVADIQMQHYAFLVDDASVDKIYQHLRGRGIEHWADPQGDLRRLQNDQPGNLIEPFEPRR